IIPHLINTSDGDKSSSVLEEERVKVRQEREAYRNKLRKSEKNYQLYRILDNFSKKNIYKIAKYN
ncbi:hypothetical protein ACDV62_19180, partial [Proteus mirabilis]